MAQVTVSIDGKQYRMACDEGQEEHLIDLAERFDRYVSHLKDSFGEIGDQRLTVMAGIMVMDELSELQKRVKGMESEVLTLRKTRDDALTKADKNDSVLTNALGALAQRMEDLTSTLAVQSSLHRRRQVNFRILPQKAKIFRGPRRCQRPRRLKVAAGVVKGSEPASRLHFTGVGT